MLSRVFVQRALRVGRNSAAIGIFLGLLFINLSTVEESVFVQRALRVGRNSTIGLFLGGFIGLPIGFVYSVATWRGFMTPEELLPKLLPSYLIEFNRGTYRHWAFYEGEGNVIHVPAEGKNVDRVTVRRESLIAVANREGGYRLVRINNLPDRAASYGYAERSVEVSLLIARYLVDKEVPYDFTNQNCEHYCTGWKYEKGFTTQGMFLHITRTASILMQLIGLVGAYLAVRYGYSTSHVISYGVIHAATLAMYTGPLLIDEFIIGR